MIEVARYFSEMLDQTFDTETDTEYNEALGEAIATISIRTEEAPVAFESFSEMLNITGTRILEFSANDGRLEIVLAWNN